MPPDAAATSPKILVLSGAKGDTRRYRTIHLHQQLKLMGLPSSLSHTTDPNLEALAEEVDVIILHRAPYDPLVARIIQKVHARQGLALLDTDDLIFDTAAFDWIDSPDFKDPVRAALYKEDMLRHRQTLEACDAGLASTEYLAGRVRALGKPCWVHRNAASLELMSRSEQAHRQPRPADGKVIIGYASGTPTHNRDFALISPVLQELLHTHPEIELRIIGHLDLEPGWEQFRDRIKRYTSVPWQELPQWLGKLDLNLAPLVEKNPFSQSKSEIKYLEAGLVGVPTVASRIGSYVGAIIDGENGLLATEPQEWRVCLETMLATERRARLGQSAYKDVIEQYSPLTRSRQAVARLNEISMASGRLFHWDGNLIDESQLKKLWWEPELERHPTEIEMGLYTLRQRGAGTLAKQVWVYFRRWLARFIPYG